MTRTTTYEAFKCVESHKDKEFVRDVLLRRSSFVRQIEKFYDCALNYSEEKGLSPLRLNIGEISSSKAEPIPADLADFLGNFSPQPIEKSRLDYRTVRIVLYDWKQHVKQHVGDGKSSAYGGLASTVLGAGFAGAFVENPWIFSPLFLVTCVGAGVTARCFKRLYSKKDFYGSAALKEFVGLCGAANDADRFIGRDYRDFLVANSLSSVPPATVATI